MSSAAQVTMPPSDSRLYSTNQLAEDAGVTARTVRFYEGKGLLNPQLAGATRVYNHSDRARLQIILRGKRLGFSLDEIKEYLDLYDADSEHVGQVLHIRHKSRERAKELRGKLKDIEDSLSELQQIERDAITQLNKMGVDPDAPPPSVNALHKDRTQQTHEKEGMDPS